MLESLDYAGALIDFSKEDRDNLIMYALDNKAYDTFKYLIVNEVSGVDTIDDLKYINSDIFRKIAESQDVKALQIIMDTNYRVHEKDISDALEYINNIQETDSADYSELIQNLNILAGNMTT